MADIAERRALESAKAHSRALAMLGTEVATKVGVAANRRAAIKLRDALVAAAPVDSSGKQSPASKRFGRLRTNIRQRRDKARKQHHIVHIVTIGAAFWGWLVERGTAKMRARPWYRPTVEREGPAMLAAQVDELRKGIERAARKAARASGMKGGT